MKFVPYSAKHYEGCLALFDENCPAYFAENEREDYASYLKTMGNPYKVLEGPEGALIAAYGVAFIEAERRARVTWIMVSPKGQGTGVGRHMMEEIIACAVDMKATALDIATSQHAAAFFAKFGARETRVIKDGWAKGMHRIDMELKL